MHLAIFVEVSDEIAPSFLDGNLGDTATNALRVMESRGSAGSEYEYHFLAVE